MKTIIIILMLGVVGFYWLSTYFEKRRNYYKTLFLSTDNEKQIDAFDNYRLWFWLDLLSIILCIVCGVILLILGLLTYL
jgi:uncharacterized membrane protein